MIDEIALQKEELRALCRRLHVRRLDLLGSAARGDFDPEQSDVDFLAEFDRDLRRVCVALAAPIVDIATMAPLIFARVPPENVGEWLI